MIGSRIVVFRSSPSRRSGEFAELALLIQLRLVAPQPGEVESRCGQRELHRELSQAPPPELPHSMPQKSRSALTF